MFDESHGDIHTPEHCTLSLSGWEVTIPPVAPRYHLEKKPTSTYSLLPSPLSLFVQTLHDQTPPITTNHTPRQIPIPHTIQIALRHVLRPAHPSRSHLLRKPLQHLPPLISRQPIPQLRLNRSRRNQIDPQRFQIQGKLPRQTVQTGSVRTDNAPIRDRVLRDRTRRNRITTIWTGGNVSGDEFPQEHGREEADHACFLD